VAVTTASTATAVANQTATWTDLDLTVQVWDAGSGAHKRTLTGNTDQIFSVVALPNGMHIV
jgi:WD40 repeat protein